MSRRATHPHSAISRRNSSSTECTRTCTRIEGKFSSSTSLRESSYARPFTGGGIEALIVSNLEVEQLLLDNSELPYLGPNLGQASLHESAGVPTGALAKIANVE